MASMAIASSFVRKLYRLLDLEGGTAIAWDDTGASFAVLDAEQLERFVLPRYFRGRLFAFRQQLREHGFQRLATAARGAEAYMHADFRRGCPERLGAITRTPQPRRRPPRRRVRAKSSTGAAAVVRPPPVPKTCHRAVADPGRVRAAQAGNPLFDEDETDMLVAMLASEAVSSTDCGGGGGGGGGKHSLDFASSDVAEARYQRLVADLQAADSGWDVNPKIEGGPWDAAGPTVPQPPARGPSRGGSAPTSGVVVESPEFSSDTLDLMLRMVGG